MPLLPVADKKEVYIASFRSQGLVIASPAYAPMTRSEALAWIDFLQRAIADNLVKEDDNAVASRR